VIDARIRHGEAGSAIEWYVRRARQLDAHWKAHPVEDLLVETADRDVREIAHEIVVAVGWTYSGDIPARWPGRRASA
jgi:hypothetical protein